MAGESYGRVLAGNADEIRRSYDALNRQVVDWDLTSEPVDPPATYQTTVQKEVSVTGPGTYFGKAHRTLMLGPSVQPGWWFERLDQEDLPIRVSVYNVWTTFRNIVLRSGSQHNYMRLAEHIIALRPGLGIDNLMIKTESGDPPLFDRGSLDLVEALDSAGVATQSERVQYVTVKEPVTVGGPHGSFLTFLPCEPRQFRLQMDCAMDFPDAIGKQRIRFNVSRKIFRAGAIARTNCTAAMKWYCKTIGQLFADSRNLGYTENNILIAGKRRYLNAPRLVHDGKVLEPIWHRALLDLLAAIALIDQGRFVGQVISYKSGHTLDVAMIRQLYRHQLLRAFPATGAGLV